MKTILLACWGLSVPFFQAMNLSAYDSGQCYALDCNDLEDYYSAYMSGGEL
jgi:hypothetical protein